MLGGCTTPSQPTVQQGPGAEVTFDGLHRVNDTISNKVWVKPDIDLSQYDELLLESAGIHYRSVKNYRRNDSSADAFPLTDAQKAKLQRAVGETLLEEIKESQYFGITDKPGRGVLKVTLGLIDVVSRVPPERMGRSEFYLRNLGQAVLVMEIRDSLTNEALARIADGTNVAPVVVQQSNPVTNLMEVRRSARVWGERIRTGLDELHQMGCYVCSVPGSIVD